MGHIKFCSILATGSHNPGQKTKPSENEPENKNFPSCRLYHSWSPRNKNKIKRNDGENLGLCQNPTPKKKRIVEYEVDDDPNCSEKVPKSLPTRLEELEIRERVKTIQTTTLEF